MTAVRRTFAPDLFNEVANHPDVSRWLFADGEIDLTEIVENQANFALQADGGGFLVVKLQEAVYEVHSLFLPEARSGTRQAMADGLAYVFCRTDCCRLLTKVPNANAAAAALASKGGFRPCFVRNDARLGETSYLALDIDDWIQTNDDLIVAGRWFHEALEEAKTASRSTRQTHPDDPAHDRAVGAAIEMFRAGQIGKALGSYNRWAGFANYLPLTLVSTAPITIDVGDAVIELRS